MLKSNTFLYSGGLNIEPIQEYLYLEVQLEQTSVSNSNMDSLGKNNGRYSLRLFPSSQLDCHAKIKYSDGLLRKYTLYKRDHVYLIVIFIQINACKLKNLTVLALDKNLPNSEAGRRRLSSLERLGKILLGR